MNDSLWKKKQIKICQSGTSTEPREPEIWSNKAV